MRDDDLIKPVVFKEPSPNLPTHHKAGFVDEATGQYWSYAQVLAGRR